MARAWLFLLISGASLVNAHRERTYANELAAKHSNCCYTWNLENEKLGSGYCHGYCPKLESDTFGFSTVDESFCEGKDDCSP